MGSLMAGIARALRALMGGPKAADATAIIRGRDGASMVQIPVGEFTMGSDDAEDDEKPAHRVRISSFCMDKYEVTFDLYDRFCEETGREKPFDENRGRGNRPVVNVTWDDAAAYASYYGERLPTEAEWEYACRAGSTGKWCFGDDESRFGEYAWYMANSGNLSQPVGTKLPNVWGLHDMHGNVSEWCADWAEAYSGEPVQDPRGPSAGSFRIARGGNWNYPAEMGRSAMRYKYGPDHGFFLCGFRCAASPGAKEGGNAGEARQERGFKAEMEELAIEVMRVSYAMEARMPAGEHESFDEFKKKAAVYTRMLGNAKDSEDPHDRENMALFVRVICSALEERHGTDELQENREELARLLFDVGSKLEEGGLDYSALSVFGRLDSLFKYDEDRVIVELEVKALFRMMAYYAGRSMSGSVDSIGASIDLHRDDKEPGIRKVVEEARILRKKFPD